MRFYAAEIILGLEHMHSRFVVYRDLKVTDPMAPTNTAGTLRPCRCLEALLASLDPLELCLLDSGHTQTLQEPSDPMGTPRTQRAPLILQDPPPQTPWALLGCCGHP